MDYLSWSEQYDPNAPGSAWRDCTQCTVLFLLTVGGLDPSKFTLGVRTWQERERFENAEGIPEYNPTAPAGSVQETGLIGYHLCDVASQKLYGVVTHPATLAQLPGLLADTSAAVGLTGQGPGLPSGYTGRHSVPVVGIGAGKVLVFDPLDPMGSAGKGATVAAILAWHSQLPTDRRYVRRDEFAGGNPNMNPASTPSLCDVTAGGSTYSAPGGSVVGPNPNVAASGVFYGGPEARADGVAGAWVKLSTGWAWIGVNHVANIRPALPSPAAGPVSFTIRGTINPDGSGSATLGGQ